MSIRGDQKAPALRVRVWMKVDVDGHTTSYVGVAKDENVDAAVDAAKREAVSQMPEGFA